MTQFKRPKNKVDGWVILNKPLDITSAQAVNIVRRAFGAAKAGHAGTLDPLASGILPIALGEATKTIPFLMDASKDYDFTINWGIETSTDDLEGEITSTSDQRPSHEQVLSVLPQFIGQIKQIPPAYSAVKLDGKRAYALARDNKKPELKPRDAHILNLVCHDHNTKSAHFSVTTGKGVYIRALARDIARALGTAAHIKSLKRNRVGNFSLNQSISLDFFQKIDNSPKAFKALHPVLTPLDDIPALDITEKDAKRLLNGQKIAIDDDKVKISQKHNHADDVVMTAICDEKLIAIVSCNGMTASPTRVFNL